MIQTDTSHLRSLGRLPMVAVALCAVTVFPSMIPAAFVPSAYLPDLPGWVIPLWIVGFLVQMVFVIWLLRGAINNGKVIVFGLASFIPWCVHWIVGVWFPADLMASLLVVGLAAWAISSLQRNYRLLAHGVRGRARVLEVLKPKMNMVVNNIYVRRSLRVEVEAPGLPRYEAVVSDLFEMFAIPQRGAVLPVRVDPARPDVLALDPA